MLMANVVQTLGKIEAYSGGRWDDVEDWIRNFEDIAKVNNWNEDVKRIQLYSNLTGTAKELYDTLPLNKKQTYEQVKNELKEAFKPYNVHQRYQMIFDKRQLPGEDVNAYAYAILNLFNRTNPGMTEVEKVIHFTRGLNDELRNYMMTQESTSVKEAIRKAKRKEDALKAIQIMNQTKIDQKLIEEMGNLKKRLLVIEEKKYNDVDKIRESRQKLRRTNDNRRFENRYENGRPICRRCQKVGHIARNCRGKEEQDKKDSNMAVVKENKVPEKYHSLFIPAQLNGMEKMIIIDTGSGFSMISRTIAEIYFEDLIEEDQTPRQMLQAANGSLMKRVGKIRMKIKIGNWEGEEDLDVVVGLQLDVILGTRFLKENAVKIDFEDEKLKFPDGAEETFMIRDPLSEVRVKTTTKIPPRSVKLVNVIINGEGDIPYELVGSAQGSVRHKILVNRGVVDSKSQYIEVSNISNQAVKLYSGMKIARTKLRRLDIAFVVQEVKPNEDQRIAKEISEWKFKNSDINEEQQERIRTLLKEYQDLFATNPKNPGQTIITKHNIDVQGITPIKQKMYRTNPIEDEVINREVNQMLENGIIRKSKSPWASPVVLIPKPDGSIRFCIDYRKLNAKTKKDVYPLPNITDTIESVRGKKYFTSIDLAAGYWQVEVEEDDKEKTAFICKQGLFEFNIMPFGLSNAPSTFQRMMDEVIRECDVEMIRDYIDDILVASETFEEHIEDLRKLFEVLRKKHLKMKLSKCGFCENSIIYLGHKISKDGIEMNNVKVEAIQRLTPPKDIPTLRSFLGMTSYYRRFIKDYAKIADPLTQLLRKGNVYRWNDRCQESFDMLKKKLMEAPILRYPDWKKDFKLETDASDVGLGAILSQKDERDQDVVIAYASRSLSGAERKYATTEKECLAIVWAIGHFRHYLFGRRFHIVTDHAALTWLMTAVHKNNRLSRWSLKLQGYDFEISHRKGKLHTNVDTLSRMDMVAVTRECEELKSAQRRDDELGKLIRYLEKKELPEEEEIKGKVIAEATQYSLIDGILMSEFATFRMIRRQKVEPRIVIPSEWKDRMLKEHHDDILAGHLGVKRTYGKLALKYYWKGMYEDVRKWVLSCDKCAQRKGSLQSKLGLTNTIIVGRPFEIVAMDVMGPLKTTWNGNKYILVFADYFTKWVEIKALKKIDGEIVARTFVQDIICRHGAPKRILSDRGDEFLNQVMDQVVKLLSIRRSTTSAYHPQTNGQVERFNRTLEDMLAIFVDKHQKNWDELLPYLTFAYRTTPHEMTGETPFYLMHGRDPNLPDDLEVLQEAMDIEEYRKELNERLEEIDARVQEYGKKIKEQHVKKLNRNRKSAEFKTQEQVWLNVKEWKKKGKSQKLMMKWEGPYRIEKYLTDVDVQLKDSTGKLVKSPIHVSRLKKFTGPRRPEKEETTERTDEYEVERILDHRLRKGKEEFLIKWKGYSEKECSWEPRDNLIGVDRLLIQYLEKHELPCQHCSFKTLDEKKLRKHQEERHS